MASSYHISKHSASSYESLVDRAANGGLAGVDVHILKKLVGKSLSLALMIMNYQV